MSYVIELPALCGMRFQAEELCKDLPANLLGEVVEIQAGNSQAVAQGFTDELCRQILEVRNADLIKLKGASVSTATHAMRAAELRVNDPHRVLILP